MAVEGIVLSASAAYLIITPNTLWLDSVNAYLELSSIQKVEDRFNDSDKVTPGAAWASGGCYIYTDWPFSTGDRIVGDRGDDYTNVSVGDFGAKENDRRNSRFNINFGYYV